MKNCCLLAFVFLVSCGMAHSQKVDVYWHGKEREVRYRPDGADFVIENGTRRFNRALYGGNTAFRAEAGDVPEFAMYLPGMGGNLKVGITNGKESKWLSEATKYVARYTPGKMSYEIRDPLLGNGSLIVTVLALYEREGMILKVEGRNVPSAADLICAYGGVTGKKFSRDGDLNVDPESNFYLKPSNCNGNAISVNQSTFVLTYPTGQKSIEPAKGNPLTPSAQKGSVESADYQPSVCGLFPDKSVLKVSDASCAEHPLALFESIGENAPVVCARTDAQGISYFMLARGRDTGCHGHQISEVFARADQARQTLADRVVVETPDPYLNHLGGVLGYAADAIWESPTFLHGAIGWRMRLNGWRGPYAGDELGWHDRARAHFDAYAASQVLQPDSGPCIPDPKCLLARQEEKMGNALFSSGYICRNPNDRTRPHHYDMNLVFVDALLRHYQWTGDLEYAKTMWPLLQRHIEWEKRNFKVGREGLYDAYCCIWASDALQYSGGGVAHSSAYNYYSNKMMARLAHLIGEDATPYEQEAQSIKTAMDSLLWYPSKGWYAEYRDYAGLKQTHPSAAVWTIYHTIDSEVPDRFEAYQMAEYVKHEIPRIPVLAKGLIEKDNYVVSTTNWMPYEWSVNNVVFAENLHTALSFWQAGRSEEAIKLFKGSVLDAMYLGGSPGNFVQMSSYDAARGESYRDFADEIGMASRALVEGLFGIQPDLPSGVVTIRPGFPNQWEHAAITIPDVKFSFKRMGGTVSYRVVPTFTKPVKIRLCVRALLDEVKSVRVNGKSTNYTINKNSVDHPEIELLTETGSAFDISIEYAGNTFEQPVVNARYSLGEKLKFGTEYASVEGFFDPQGVLGATRQTDRSVNGIVKGETGHRTMFVRMKQKNVTWWHAVCFEICPPYEVIASNEPTDRLIFRVKNNTGADADVLVTVNGECNAFSSRMKVSGGSQSTDIFVPKEYLINGYNVVTIEAGDHVLATRWVANWTIRNPKTMRYEKLDLTHLFNDKVTNLFKNSYTSPRCPYPTLALPTSGIGDWTHPAMTANIDDSGVRQAAGNNNEIVTPQGVPFATPGDPESRNVIFTSQWDNFPKEMEVPVDRTASHVYMLMAGSTNYMQSRFTNATVYANYTDGSKDSLVLRNPETWFPIEQDYYIDGYAFPFNAPRPQRLYLKTAEFTFRNNSVREGFRYNAGQIDGGAAIVLDMPLKSSKKVKSLVLRTTANDVVVGLMSVTLAK